MPRKFYCSLTTLESLALYPEDMPELRALLTHHEVIMLDVPKAELEAQLDDPDSVLTSLLRIEAGNFVVDTQPGCQTDAEVLLRAEAAGALFVLDHSPVKCEQLGRQFGVCAVSGTHGRPVSTLTSYFFRQLEKGTSYRTGTPPNAREGWPAVLAEEPLLPINAVVLIDNYLLKDEEIGKQSAVSILDALLPPTLDAALPFQILLVVSVNGYPLKSKVLNRVIDYIEEKLKLSRKYPIEVGILTHNGNEQFHRRVVISNYHFLHTDRGFTHFQAAKATKHNDITIKGAYHDLTRLNSHLAWRSMALDLRLVKNLLAENKALRDAGREEVIQTNLMRGACNNRLLDLV